MPPFTGIDTLDYQALTHKMVFRLLRASSTKGPSVLSRQAAPIIEQQGRSDSNRILTKPSAFYRRFQSVRV